MIRRARHLPSDGGHIDDAPAALVEHMFESQLATKIGGLRIDIHDDIPMFLAYVKRQGDALHARIVDQRIKAMKG